MSGEQTFEGRVPTSAKEIMSQLIRTSITQAQYRAKERLLAWQMATGSPTPIDTGLLRSSFNVVIMDRTIVGKWSAIRPADPRQFDYAAIVNQRQPYSEQVKEKAKQILVEELIRELKTLYSGPSFILGVTQT